jgi:hypothetical protein
VRLEQTVQTVESLLTRMEGEMEAVMSEHGWSPEEDASVPQTVERAWYVMGWLQREVQRLRDEVEALRVEVAVVRGREDVRLRGDEGPERMRRLDRGD